MFLKTIILLFSLLIFSSPILVGFNKGDFGVGLNYPGLGVRCFTGSRTAVEIKWQNGEGVVIGGLRGYRYFDRTRKVSTDG